VTDRNKVSGGEGGWGGGGGGGGEGSQKRNVLLGPRKGEKRGNKEKSTGSYIPSAAALR